ncbi:MAG TPA: TolC family protein [Candidatus Eisenbacteria bacterium]|nr:TolC family protein [Candidatus Eisenbacteria bacterium]
MRPHAHVVLLAALLAGCPLARPPEQPAVLEQALPKGTTVPPAWNAPASPEAVRGDWVKSFGDPGLEAVVAEAIASNPDLRRAAASVEIARQTVVVVGARLWPQIGARIGAARTRDVGEDEANSNMEYVGLAWELDVWGRIRAQRAAAKESYEATALDYAFARQSLAATTAKSWYLAIATHALVELAQRAVALYAEQLDLVRVRQAAGRVAEFDVVQAKASLAAAESELRAVQADSSAARRALELLLGRYPAGDIALRAGFVPAPPPVAAGLPSALLERRPDVAAAERRVLAAFRLHEAAKLALLPSFAITVEGGRLSDKILDLLQLNPTILHAAIGMEIPIYQGGALLARVKIATAEQEAAVAAYASAALAAFAEVENALTNQVTLAERIQYDRQALDDRIASVKIVRTRYTAGASDMLTVIILESEALAAERNVIELQNAQLANRIDLHLALGGDFGT